MTKLGGTQASWQKVMLKYSAGLNVCKLNCMKLTIVKTYDVRVIDAIEDNNITIILNQGKCNENFEILTD